MGQGVVNWRGSIDIGWRWDGGWGGIKIGCGDMLSRWSGYV